MIAAASGLVARIRGRGCASNNSCVNTAMQGAAGARAGPEYASANPGCIARSTPEYSSAVIRLLAIMVFVFGGLPGLGIGMLGALVPDRGHQCQESGCHVAVVETSCCLEEIDQDYCITSAGPCQCGVAPLPNPKPRPDAPISGPDRDRIVTAPRAALQPVPILSAAATHPRVVAARLSLLAGMTHNDIQAFLGTWRT